MALVSSSTWGTTSPLQRQTVRLGDGTWIAGFVDAGKNLAMARSNDNSVPWASITQSPVLAPNFFSLATLDGYLFLVLETSNNVYFYRGAVSPDRSTVTWGAVQTIDASGFDNGPTLTVHREGTAWRVFITWSYNNGSNYAVYCRGLSMDISTGAVTLDAANTTIKAVTTGNGGAASIAKHPVNNSMFAITWQTGAAGAGKGVRAVIGTWNGTTMTWGAEEPVTETVYVFQDMSPCMIDSQGRVLVAFRDTTANHYLRVFRRPVGGGAWVDISPPTQAGAAPTIALDVYDNLFLWYTNSGLFRRDYTGTWGAQVTVDVTNTSARPTARQDTIGGFADVLYTTGASPYSVYSARIPAAGGNSKTRRGYNAPIVGRGRRGIVA